MYTKGTEVENYGILFNRHLLGIFIVKNKAKGSEKCQNSVRYDLNGSLPCLADFVAADDDPGQVEAEEEDDDAEGDVRHVQLAMVFALVRL